MRWPNFLNGPALPSSKRGRFVLWLLRVYKKYFSFLFWGSCRFTPTCSEYTYQQVRKHGTIRGLWAGFKRILTCVG